MENIQIPVATLSPIALRSFSPQRLDALKEVASIGAGHAATALSLMTGARIMIDVPMVNVGNLSELVPSIALPDAAMVSVTMDMHGSLTGQTLLALPVATGRRLADLMLRRERRPGVQAFDMLEESALKEAGNILGGAYMTALSDFLEMQLMPSPPRFRTGTAREILDACALADTPDVAVCCVETEFSFEEIGERFRGFFLLLPDRESFGAIFRAVKLS
ncbi:MAG TPA: chemotaxis protein CheC [Gemmatimonadaceae bacterium]|nr:chemotaxis protein CheC [Gemmatimonadaceae bacterium]